VNTSGNCAEFLKELLEPLLVRGVLAVHVRGSYYLPLFRNRQQIIFTGTEIWNAKGASGYRDARDVDLRDVLSAKGPLPIQIAS
jgi:hypothetical protein